MISTSKIEDKIGNNDKLLVESMLRRATGSDDDEKKQTRLQTCRRNTYLKIPAHLF